MLLSLSCVQLFAILRTVALQAPLSVGFPRQEYLSGLPFPSTRDLSSPGIKPVSPVTPALAASSLPLSHLGGQSHYLQVLGIWSYHFMGNRWGNSVRLYFWGLQNHHRWLLQPWNQKTHLGRKVMTNLGSILKSRDITLSTKVHLVKAMVFPVVMYGCESWTIKKAKHRRIDAFSSMPIKWTTWKKWTSS